MTRTDDTIRVVIPFTIRKRNGRPKILPPKSTQALEDRSQDPHILKALGRAWAWRRRLENGEVATAAELAKIERVTERFVSRTVRLSYLSPEVLHSMVILSMPSKLTLPDLIRTASSPWRTQFGDIHEFI